MTAWTEKTCVVTGATGGIGLVTARELARLGMRTIVVGRDGARLEKTVADVRAFARHERVESALCDFASMASIRALARDLTERCPRIDVLVNNAGGINSSRHETKDGLEMTFGVNHIGYFLLTTLLLDVLKRSAPARIVNVASNAHTRGKVDFDDLQYKKRRYFSWDAYCASKLMNIMFTRELARRLAGTGVTASSVHPGFVASGFGHTDGGINSIMIHLARPFTLTPEQGARTSIYVATSAEIEGVTGKYFAKSREKAPARRALDDDVARRLWTVSEELTAPR